LNPEPEPLNREPRAPPASIEGRQVRVGDKKRGDSGRQKVCARRISSARPPRAPPSIPAVLRRLEKRLQDENLSEIEAEHVRLLSTMSQLSRLNRHS